MSLEISKLKTIFTTKTFKAFSWYSLAQIVVQGLALLSVIIVSRYLGPQNLGLLSFVQNYLATFLTIVAGMDFYFVWKLARTEYKEKEVVHYIGHKINIFLVITITGLVAAFLTLPHSIAIMVAIMILPSFLQSLTAFNLYSTVVNKAREVALFQIISSIILFLIKALLVHQEASLYSFIIVATIDMFLTSILFSFYYLKQKHWRELFKQEKSPSFLESFHFVYAIKTSIVALALWQLMLRADQLILATFSEPYLLGIYTAAVKIAEMPNFLAGILSTALISKISSTSLGETNAIKKSNSQKMIVVFLSIGIIISLGIAALAIFIVPLLYGKEFIDSVSVLRIYAFSIPAIFLNYLFLGMYSTQERYFSQIIIFGGAILLNALLMYTLFPLYGLVGAAFSTVIAYSLSAFLFYYYLLPKKVSE
ncbi:MAG: hypothetical protein RI935_774 [Candidatus Parcubacteria bacterium]|jgi:O-antigen/teichoic acid export membrane protein